MNSLERPLERGRIDVVRDIAGCAATIPLQESVWRGDQIVPPQLMLAAVDEGGFVALGYIDGDERPAGFVFGFVGLRSGVLRHHSHMLAVRRVHRGTGLAQALKEAQRNHCLTQGIDIITWTMDPLETRNAQLNFGRLGATARAYRSDYYGAMQDDLNRGLPSDRLYLEWPIASDRARRRLQRKDVPGSPDDAEFVTIPYLLRAYRGRPQPIVLTEGEPTVLVEVPQSFQELKVRDIGLALLWRMAAREAFELAFCSGYSAVDFLRGADGRCAYVLTADRGFVLPGSVVE